MKNFIQGLIKKRHYLIVNEADVMELIDLFNECSTNASSQQQAIGNCGVVDGESKWYIFITVSNTHWKCIEERLDSKGFDIEIKTNKIMYIIRRKESIMKRLKKAIGF